MTRLSGEARRGLRTAALRRLAASLLAGALPLALGACSAVPEWADPTDWFAEDQAPSTISAKGAEEAAEADFPNLASVPGSRPQVLSAETRGQLQADLAADRANAEYTGERLTGTQAATGQGARGTGSAGETAPAAPSIAASVTERPAAPEPERAMTAPEPEADTAAPEAEPKAAATPPAAQTAQAGQAGEEAPPAPEAGRETQLKFPQFQEGAAAAGARAPVAARSDLVAVIYFAHGSAALNENDRRVLRQVGALQRERGGRVRVIGHSSARTGTVDATTHRTVNLEMSMKRANSVRDALISLGVSGDRVTAEARGDAQPVYHEFMPTGEAGNRRAEIFLEY